MSLLDGEAAVASASLPGGTSDAVLSVGSPKLWWPVGMGSGPFLYSLHVATPTDSFRTRVGLRGLRASRPLPLRTRGGSTRV